MGVSPVSFPLMHMPIHVYARCMVESVQTISTTEIILYNSHHLHKRTIVLWLAVIKQTTDEGWLLKHKLMPSIIPKSTDQTGGSQ